jgi:hypothetical protein
MATSPTNVADPTWKVLTRRQLARACFAFGIKNTGTADVLRARLVNAGADAAQWLKDCSREETLRVVYKLTLDVKIKLNQMYGLVAAVGTYVRL